MLEEIADSGPTNKSGLPASVVTLKAVQSTWYAKAPPRKEQSVSGVLAGM